MPPRPLWCVRDEITRSCRCLTHLSALQFDFYQYFLRADDRDVDQLLKSFTFLDVDEIAEIVHEHNKAPEKRAAQRVLADCITTTMHGEAALRSAHDATELLFGKGASSAAELTAAKVMAMAGDAPLFDLSRDKVVGHTLVDVAVAVGLAKSKAECRRLIKDGGVYLNQERVTSDAVVLEGSNLVDGSILLLRSGRRNNVIVRVA
jgi:tyrosyl-tRNA synthetase